MVVIQHWHVLNLDKRQTLGQDPWPGIHHLLSTRAPRALLSHLTSPTTTTTGRSSNRRPGSWSGDRIIILSDHALTYPEGTLTPSEMDEVEDMYLDSEEGSRYGDDGGEGEEDGGNQTTGVGAPTLYAFAEEWYSPVHVPVVGVAPPPPTTTTTTTTAGEATSSLSSSSRGPADVWYLRNLNKKEYVRSDKVGSAGKDEKKKYGLGDSPPEGLGHALVVLACWTTGELVEKFGPGSDAVEVGQGRWAGDKLDVKVGSEAEVGLGGGGGVDKDGQWKDVSEEVGKVLDVVWKGLPGRAT